MDSRLGNQKTEARLEFEGLCRPAPRDFGSSLIGVLMDVDGQCLRSHEPRSEFSLCIGCVYIYIDNII